MPKKTKVPQNQNEKPRRVAAARKKSGASVKKAGPLAKKKSPVSTAPTDEEVRLRAYFISERRHRLALSGDASSDWLEARRQLFSELGPR
jgi:hypothetical protein